MIGELVERRKWENPVKTHAHDVCRHEIRMFNFIQHLLTLVVELLRISLLLNLIFLYTNRTLTVIRDLLLSFVFSCSRRQNFYFSLFIRSDIKYCISEPRKNFLIRLILAFLKNKYGISPIPKQALRSVRITITTLPIRHIKTQIDKKKNCWSSSKIYGFIGGYSKRFFATTTIRELLEHFFPLDRNAHNFEKRNTEVNNLV